MKRTVVALLASAAVAMGASVAFAQQSPPSNTRINDGINGAPNYNPMAPAGAGTNAKINDGINGAPNYNAATATAPTPQATKRQAASAKSSTTQMHAHHHKRHTPAS